MNSSSDNKISRLTLRNVGQNEAYTAGSAFLPHSHIAWHIPSFALPQFIIMLTLFLPTEKTLIIF